MATPPPPHFYINSPFSGLSPLSSKIVRTPPTQVTQFLEGPTPPLTMYGVELIYQGRLGFIK